MKKLLFLSAFLWLGLMAMKFPGKIVQPVLYPRVVKNNCTDIYAVKLGPHSFLGHFHYPGNTCDAVKIGTELKFPDSATALHIMHQFADGYNVAQKNAIEAAMKNVPDTAKCRYK